MHRREFVRTTGAAGSALALTACAPTFGRGLPTAAPVPRNVATRGHADHDGRWADAVHYARWAPSPHNIQQWRLRVVHENQALLYCDADRRLPDTDPQSAFTMVTFAVFVEYLSIAFAAEGLLLTAEFIDAPIDYSSREPQLVATLSLEPMPKRLDARARRDAMCNRQTSRLPYNGECARTEVLEKVQRLSAAEGYEFHWTHDREDVRAGIAINRDAVFADMNIDVARRELRRWVRPSDQEAYASPDGLWSRCMCYPGWLLRDFFDHHRAWVDGPRAALAKRLLTHGMRGTRTLGWFSGPFAGPADWVRAGRVLGHAWLLLSQADIQLHPFGSVVTNPEAHQRFLNMLGDTQPTNTMWFLARLGYSDEPTRSLRVPTSAIFYNDAE